MMVNFTTSTPANNYIGTNITVTCDKKIMRVCEAWVSKSNDNRNQTCILTISATSDHGSITVSNGAKYMSCKVEIGFYKGVQCVRGANDHQEIVEALYGGGVPIEQSSRNPTNAGPTNAGTPNASPTNASTTNASITKSAGGAVKDSTNITPTTSDKTTKVQSCAAAKNTLCISLMLALIFWSIYF
ncbi:Hypothetical predicted protein [Paramuricea clavata]|nr:Hypothetical predicted protein [Paramuricea clavata]